MWFSNTVEIPDVVVEAASAGNLVIFVGAGVSVADPSNLPMFDELAAAVARDLRADPKADGVRTDDFLANLEHEHLDIRTQVIAHIGDPASMHNDLHRAIVRLFPTIDALRIVTTNYDPHLTSATVEHFGIAPNVCRAPALPLGRDFRGIVHVHGDLIGRPEDLVLTSRDFGSAYLTDAYAARFLVELFGKYVTLFIGYSHNDIIISYLARGLRPGSLRFGLTANPDAATEWRRLDLEPIEYPYTADHGELLTAITNWADWAQMGVLDHERQIALRLGDPPPVTPSGTSYLERVLTDDDTVRYFALGADGIEWLDWILDRAPFPTLFDPAIRLSPAAFVFAQWFAKMVVAEPDKTLVVVQHHGGRLNPDTAMAVGRELRANPPDPKSLGRWAVLLTLIAGSDVSRTLNALLGGLRWPDDRDNGLLLFRHLVGRVVQLSPALRLHEDGAEPTVEFSSNRLVGEDHGLRSAWDRYFLPHLDDLALALMPIVVSELDAAHQLLRASGQAGDEFDVDSYRRTSIAPDDQDRIGWPYAFVIDAARACLESLCLHQPEAAASWIDLLERSQVPLLRRLGIHGWIVRADRTDGEKIDHLVEADLLFRFATMREVYRLLAATLPGAGPDGRSRLLDAITAGPVGEHARDDVSINRQLVIDLLAHVTAVADPWPEAAEAIQRVQADVDAAVHPSPHPGYASWIGPSGFGGTPPIPVDSLYGCRTAAELTTLVDEAIANDPNSYLWDLGLPNLIASAGAQRPEWSLAILRDLLTRGDWTSRYWEHLVGGLSRVGAQLDPAVARAACALLADVVGLIATGNAAPELVRPVSEFLMNAVHRSSIDVDVLDPLERVGVLVTSSIALGPAGHISDDPDGPLERAFNNWTGWLARFWVDVISHRWKLAGDSWIGIPNEMRPPLEAILHAPEPYSIYPQAIVASRYDLFAGADEGWALDHVRPLFSFSRDVASAARAWAAFVDGATLTEPILRQLRTEFAPGSRELRGRVGVAFAQRIAEVMVRSAGDYVSDGTLADFVAFADEEMRVAFAHQVGWWLVHQMPRPYGEEQWSKWILGYLTERIAARPRALSVLEAAEMLPWVVAAGTHLPAAVELYVQTPARFSETYGFPNDLERHQVLTAHPLAAAALLAFVLERVDEVLFWCDEITTFVDALLGSLDAASRPTLLRICESAARLRCSEAQALRASVEARWPVDPSSGA